MINPIANHTLIGREINGEQNLLDDLSREFIQLHGMDVVYLPRLMMSPDSLFGESNQNAFTVNFVIEMFLETSAGFEGKMDFISKIGYTIDDDLTLNVSRTRFKEEAFNIKTVQLPNPREGDLIFIPMIGKLFEIKFVEGEKPFYQLGNRYIWTLKIEFYKNDHAFFNTGIEAIDAINRLRRDDNRGNDISKEPNQDNEQIKTEADGAKSNGFSNKPKKIEHFDPENPQVPFFDGLTRGTGVVSMQQPPMSGFETSLEQY